MALNIERKPEAPKPRWDWDSSRVNVAVSDGGTVKLVFATSGISPKAVALDGSTCTFADRAYYEEAFSLQRVLNWNDITITVPAP
jgi:hypothetical protein